MPLRYLLTAVLCLLACSSIGASIPTRALDLETFRDRLRGGWAGQMIGVSYGSIYEFRSLNRPILGPLREWKPEFIANSINQDDIYVEMTFLKTLDTHGPRATQKQAGLDFRDSKYRLWHANMAGRTNLQMGIMPPQSGHPRYNPHSDDIDFQIEADVFGLITPGMPRAMERMCDVFGSIINYGDGLYGGRFVAGMYCRAYLESAPTKDAVRRCLDAGLASIPANSDYARTIRDVIDGFELYPGDWQLTWQTIQDRWGDQDICPEGFNRPFNIDAKVNGAYIAIGLLYGEGDFDKTLEITTRCGQDADCNPSNAAGVLGALFGYSRIPAKYTSGIPALTGRKFEYTDYDYPELIQVCEKVALRVLLENGGRVAIRNGREVLEIPLQTPSAPGKLQQVKDFPLERHLAWAKEFEARRIRLTMPESWNGWKIVATGPDMEPGVHKVRDREGVLVIHPVNESAPGIIERTVRIPSRNPRFILTLASFADQEESDWELRALVDGKQVDSRVVRTMGKWQDVEIDLMPFAGREVKLRVENRAGGERKWAWEAAYIARADVTGEP